MEKYLEKNYFTLSFLQEQFGEESSGTIFIKLKIYFSYFFLTLTLNEILFAFFKKVFISNTFPCK